MNRFYVSLASPSQSKPADILCIVKVPSNLTRSHQIALAIAEAKRHYKISGGVSAFPVSDWGTGRQMAAQRAGIDTIIAKIEID